MLMQNGKLNLLSYTEPMNRPQHISNSYLCNTFPIPFNQQLLNKTLCFLDLIKSSTCFQDQQNVLSNPTLLSIMGQMCMVSPTCGYGNCSTLFRKPPQQLHYLSPPPTQFGLCTCVLNWFEAFNFANIILEYQIASCSCSALFNYHLLQSHIETLNVNSDFHLPGQEQGYNFHPTQPELILHKGDSEWRLEIIIESSSQSPYPGSHSPMCLLIVRNMGK